MKTLIAVIAAAAVMAGCGSYQTSKSAGSTAQPSTPTQTSDGVLIGPDGRTPWWPLALCYLLSTLGELALSPIGSPRPSWVSRGERKIAWPPNWIIPASNDRRVRVEAFSKIIPRTRFFSGSNSTPR